MTALLNPCRTADTDRPRKPPDDGRWVRSAGLNRYRIDPRTHPQALGLARLLTVGSEAVVVGPGIASPTWLP